MTTRDELKEQIKDRCDIVEFINQYLPLKRAGNNFKGLCPFHQEKTPSFTVYPDSQHYYCFGCHRGGDAFTFIMEHESIDFPGAIRLLGQHVGIEVPERPAPGSSSASAAAGPPGIRKDDLYLLHEKLTRWYQSQLRSPEAKVALEYCRERGLTDELLEKFQLGYAPDGFDAVKTWGRQQEFSLDLMLAAGVLTRQNEADPITKAYDRFRHRLMFPIWNPQGRVIAFSGRVLEAEQKGGKYVNSPETPIFHKGGVLYGLPLARAGIREHGACLLCEGQMDVIACHAAGVAYAVAPQGTAFTETQARLIKRYTDRLILAFDADEAGINATLKSIDAFAAAGLAVKVVPMTEGEDPDSLVRKHGPEALPKKIAEAKDFFEFLFEVHLERQEENPAGKMKAVQAYLEEVAKIENHLEFHEYCQLLIGKLSAGKNLEEYKPLLDAVHRQVNLIRNRRRRSNFSRQKRQEQPETGETQDLMPALDKMLVDAEAHLLDLCLYHQSYPQQLLEELPSEYLSQSPVGQALNEVLAHTAQGEWENVREMLLEQMAERNCPELNKALMEPAFGPETEPRKLELCYLECVGRIMCHHLDKKISALKQELSTIKDAAEKSEKRRECYELSDERKKYQDRREAIS